MTQQAGPFAAGAVDRAPRPAQQNYEPIHDPTDLGPDGLPVLREARTDRLATRLARQEAVIQGALVDRHRQIEALLGRPVPRSAMMTGQAGDQGVGVLPDADYEARLEAMRREFPDRLAAIETRADLAARLSGHRTVSYYDTPRGQAAASTRPDGSLWLETPDGYSGPLSRFPGARPHRVDASAANVAPDAYGSTASARQRSIGERLTSTFEDAAARNPIMALGRLVVGGGFDEFEDPEHPGQTIRYASFGQEARDYERERRDSYDLMAGADRWNDGDASFLHKALRGAATLGGALGGSLTDPTNLIAPGDTAIGRILGGAAVNVAGDVVTQGADVGAGVQDHYDVRQTVAAGVLGAAIQGGSEGLGALGRRFSGNPGGVVGAVASEIDAASLRLADRPASASVRAAAARVHADALDAERIGPADGHTRQEAQRSLDSMREPNTPGPEGDTTAARSGGELAADEARFVRAVTEVREASGTVLDAARVMRETPDLIDNRRLPLTGEFVTVARSLARLSPEAFDRVSDGAIPLRFGAVVGELAPGRPDLQGPMIDLLQSAEPRSLDEARALGHEVRLADSARRENLGTDGVDEGIDPVQLIGRGQLRAAVLQRMRSDAGTFSRLIRETDAVDAGGQALARTDGEARLAVDLVAFSAMDRLDFRGGVAGHTFSDAAAAVARGDLDMAQASRRVSDALKVAAMAGDAAAEMRRILLDPGRPSVSAKASLDPFDTPGGSGQAKQIEPKPEDAEAEAAAAARWDDLPEVGDEERALNVLRVCAPGGG